MGKNKKKRPLDISSSSSNLSDVSLNKKSPEAEKSWDANQKNQILSTNHEAKKLFAFKDCLNGKNENKKENENEYTEVDGTFDAAEEVRNLSNSSDILQGPGVTTSFESYVQSLARRRYHSLENRLDQKMVAIKNSKKEDFLKVVPTQKFQDQQHGMDGKNGKIHQLTHPKKKIKMSIYNDMISESIERDVNSQVSNEMELTVLSNTNVDKHVDKHVTVEGDVNSQALNEMELTVLSNTNVDKHVDKYVTVEGDVNSQVLNEMELTVLSNTNVDKHVTVEGDVNSQALNEMESTVLSNTNVVRQDKAIIVHNSMLRPDAVTTEANKSITNSVIEHIARSKSRPPMTEQQKKCLREVQLRTVFIEGQKDDLRKYFKHMPRQLNKEIVKVTRGEVESIFITQQGAIKIIARDEAQKNQLLKIQTLNEKSVKTSVPFSVQFLHTPNKPPPVKRQDADYFVKGVVYGLLECPENLDEIALENGAHHIQRLGNPAFSKASLIAYPKETVLPQFLEVDGRRYRIYPYVPKPLRCFRCQHYGHSVGFCRLKVVCSGCSGNHSFAECPDKTNKKCANCGQGHSAADRNCPLYIKTQTALRIRAQQNVPFADAVNKVGELQRQNVNLNVAVTNTSSYSSKVKIGLQTQTEADTSNNHENINSRDCSADQLTEDTKSVPSHDENTKEFINFNYNNYKAINVAQPNKTNIEEFDPLTCKLMTFVLGCLAAIDKSKDKQAVKNTICDVASDFLFDGEIQFRWRA